MNSEAAPSNPIVQSYCSNNPSCFVSAVAMPRTFKFSFPLPRWKTSSDQQSASVPSPQRMYSDDTDDLPMSSPGTKAEEVLGTSEYNNIDLLEQPPRRPRRLRKQPSFMSVTISDAGSDSVKDMDDELLSGRSMSGDRSHHQPSITRNQPSSPLLGSFASALEERHSGSDLLSPKSGYSPSSATMRSCYDAAKGPLLVSQQTSTSSARDLALRKGCPQISSPLARNDSWQRSQDRVDNETPPAIIESQTYRPRHIDLWAVPPPRLNPSQPHVHSPHLYPTSPPQPSLLSRTHKSISDRTRWLGWDKRKTKNLNPGLNHPPHSDSPHNHDTPPPKYEPSDLDKHAHNWFDGIEGSAVAETVGLESKPRVVTMRQFPQEPQDDLHVTRDSASGDLLVGQAGSNPRLKYDHVASTHGIANVHIDQQPQPQHRHRSLSQQNEIRSTPSIQSQRSVLSGQSNRNTLSGMDLLNQSVLALSSSEDESEENVEVNDRPKRHRIRESVDCADKGEIVLVLNAERIKPLKPHPIVNARSRRGSRSSSSEGIPPVPTIPARPMLSPRVSSMKWQEQKNIRNALDTYANSVDSDWEPVTPSSRISRSSRSSSHRKLNERESRMMAVTPDEEKLLEGMRRKRASIRHNNNIDLQSVRDSITLRPKTAGEDKSTQHLGSHMSQSFPMEDLARSLNDSYAASVDDLSREIEYFPDIPRLHGHVDSGSSPKKSPSLTFTASDLVPSTPTSRRSPVTPPAGLGHLDAYSGPYAVSPSRNVYIAKNKHERKRTVSSSVVVLDGAEQRAQQLDEEDEITGWAMNRW